MSVAEKLLLPRVASVMVLSTANRRSKCINSTVNFHSHKCEMLVLIHTFLPISHCCVIVPGRGIKIEKMRHKHYLW